jgi:hypothetical protein
MVGTRSLLLEIIGGERKSPPPAVLTSTGTNLQVALIAWTPPANAVGYLEKLVISNQTSSGAVVTIWDQDITSTGTVPPTRGSTSAPLLAPINVAANSQVIYTADQCRAVEFQGGICAQTTQQPLTISVDYIEQAG